MKTFFFALVLLSLPFAAEARRETREDRMNMCANLRDGIELAAPLKDCSECNLDTKLKYDRLNSQLAARFNELACDEMLVHKNREADARAEKCKELRKHIEWYGSQIDEGSDESLRSNGWETQNQRMSRARSEAREQASELGCK